MKKYIYIILTNILICNICYANNINCFIENQQILKILVIFIFLICYILVIIEEFIKIKKSVIVIIFSSIIWVLISSKIDSVKEKLIIQNFLNNILLEYCELLLFLIVAMAYINSIKSYGVLNILKYLIINNNLSLKKIYWITGVFAFILSPIADNLTTALLMCSIIISIESNDKKFINTSCVNVIVAANAGGAFSPFGDITTLMLWQNNILSFKSFFDIFIPSLVNFLVPCIIMSYRIPNKKPVISKKKIYLKKNSIILVCLFFITIVITIIIQTFFKLPSALGMMTGLSFLLIYQKTNKDFNLIQQISKIEWETLFFFYGIMLCVSALAALGILDYISKLLYNSSISNTISNTILGIISAVIDNIPITFAIINMNPNMNESQWLLLTYTVGTGGSLLSIGSAAGIAIMGITKNYTFFSHLKHSWAILLGYILGILIHLYIN